jgi:hypothetical protein
VEGDSGPALAEILTNVRKRFGSAHKRERHPLPVPKLCPRGAFLAFVAGLTELGISNLQIPRIAWGFKSPSPHQNVRASPISSAGADGNVRNGLVGCYRGSARLPGRWANLSIGPVACNSGYQLELLGSLHKAMCANGVPRQDGC